YMPTAAEYPLGGYEPSYGHKTYGLPAQVTPETERILIETGVRLVQALFPEREAPAVEGWLATGALPEPPPGPPLVRPPRGDWLGPGRMAPGRRAGNAGAGSAEPMRSRVSAPSVPVSFRHLRSRSSSDAGRSGWPSGAGTDSVREPSLPTT